MPAHWLRVATIVGVAGGCGRIGFSPAGSDGGPVDVTPLTGDALVCPAGYNRVSDHCYRFVLTPTADWLLAEQQCEGDGAHLAVTDDATEGQVIASLGISDVFWIGESDRIVEGDYRTVTGQAAYLAWQSGFPIASDDCVETGGTLLKTLPCLTGNEYLCEYDGLPTVPSNF